MQPTEAAPNRADPRKRPLVSTQAGTLRFGRPDRKYKMANPNDPIHGLQIHLDRGWEKVNGSKDGDKERVNGGKVEANGTVSFQGQVLVWIPLEVFEADQDAKRQALQARHAKSRGKGGIDGIVDVEGNPASDFEKRQ